MESQENRGPMPALTPSDDLQRLPAAERSTDRIPPGKNTGTPSILMRILTASATFRMLFAAKKPPEQTQQERLTIPDTMMPTVLRSHIVGLSVKDTRYLPENPDLGTLADVVEDLATKIEHGATPELLAEAHALMDHLDTLCKKWDAAWLTGKQAGTEAPFRTPTLDPERRKKAFGTAAEILAK